MNFSQMFLLYFLTLAVLVVTDLLWILAISHRLYRANLDRLLRARFSIIPAAIFYFLLALGLMVFAVVPAYNNDSSWQAIGMGAIFGLCTSGTYSLVNLSIMRNWTQLISLTDIIQGAIVSGVACTAAFYVSQRF